MKRFVILFLFVGISLPTFCQVTILQGTYHTFDGRSIESYITINGLETYLLLNRNGLIFLASGHSFKEAFADSQSGIIEGRIKAGTYTFDQTYVDITWKSGGTARWEYAAFGDIRLGKGQTAELVYDSE